MNKVLLHKQQLMIVNRKPVGASTLLCCWFASEVESFCARDAEDAGFIFTSSASKAGARVFTTASSSDCCVRDCTSKRSKKKKDREGVSLSNVAPVSWTGSEIINWN